jgi:hypothetical protein
MAPRCTYTAAEGTFVSYRFHGEMMLDYFDGDGDYSE